MGDVRPSQRVEVRPGVHISAERLPDKGRLTALTAMAVVIAMHQRISMRVRNIPYSAMQCVSRAGRAAGDAGWARCRRP